MTTEINVKLKPCLSCGGEVQPFSFGQEGKGTYEETHGVTCEYCTLDAASINGHNGSWAHTQIDTLLRAVRELRGAVKKAQGAFLEYQMDVDEEPPYRHRKMMAEFDGLMASTHQYDEK